MKEFLITALKVALIFVISGGLVFVGVLLGIIAVVFLNEVGVWGFIPLILWMLLTVLLLEAAFRK